MSVLSSHYNQIIQSKVPFLAARAGIIALILASTIAAYILSSYALAAITFLGAFAAWRADSLLQAWYTQRTTKSASQQPIITLEKEQRTTKSVLPHPVELQKAKHPEHTIKKPTLSTSSLPPHAFFTSPGHLTFSANTQVITASMLTSIPKGQINTVSIPTGVTSIEQKVFHNCTGLTSVSFPDSLTTIGNSAFRGCTRLTELTLPDGLTTIETGAVGGAVGGAFCGCRALTSVSLSDSLTTIESWTFFGCWALTSVSFPDGLTTIGGCAFRYCIGLTHLILPNGLTTIDSCAFEGCTGLTHIILPDGVTTIEFAAFFGCTGLTSVSFPDGLTTIRRCAFYGCTGLTELPLPNGLTSIGKDAFEDCTGLTSVSFPDGLTTIGQGAFIGCTGLISLTFPEGLTTIDYNAFHGCTGLQYIVIPQSLEHHDEAYWQHKGIDPARTQIITEAQLLQLPQFQAFVKAKNIDSHTNPHEIATLFLVDQGRLPLPQAREQLNIRQRITKLSLSNLFSLPIQKNLILPEFATYQNLTETQAIIQAALAPLGRWAVQAAFPLASWLSWQDIARLWLAKAQAPHKICPPALQAAQIQKHKDTSQRHDEGYPKDDNASANASFAMRSLLSQRPRSTPPNHQHAPRTSCTKN
jgi:hypothetical protein